jgi:nickel-dependent lactate racemase
MLSEALAAAPGLPSHELSTARVASLIDEAIARFDVGGRRVLVLVPDRTRTGPIAALRPLVSRALDRNGAAGVTWLIALGTHRPLRRDELEDHLGVLIDPAGRTPDGEVVVNHAFHAAEDLTEVGTLAGETLAGLSGGFFRAPVPVRINAQVLSHDLLIVLGPVFPHEVVGFSGGNKYLFPGISGPEMIDVSHWLGALITSREIIGRLGTTPVRALIDAAARTVPIERRCLAFVVAPHSGGAGERGARGILGLFSGTCEHSWEAAASLAAKVHVRRLAAPVRRVVAVIPERYEDLWTAGKGMYKLEPVVADGGEVVLYAPHLRAVSRMHGEAIRRVGYHGRDYILAHFDELAEVPLGVLAHSTHVHGQGTYDPVARTERARVRVTLASGLGPAACAAINLAYADPATIDLDALAADPDTLVVPDAGEQLYRLSGEPDHLPPNATLFASIAALRGAGGD